MRFFTRVRVIISITIASALLILLNYSFKELYWIGQYLTHSQRSTPSYNIVDIPKCPNCNLLLISLDTLRADQLGFLGSKAKLTPNLDKIASKSINFLNAYTNAYFTTPSHMTAFTSLYPFEHKVEGSEVVIKSDQSKKLQIGISSDTARRLSEKYVTLAEVLSSNGYETHWNASMKSRFLRLTDGFSRGFDNFNASPFIRGFFQTPSHEQFQLKSIAPIVETTNQPQFVFLHSWVNHSPHFFRNQKDQLATSKFPLTSDYLIEGFLTSITRSAATLNWQLATPFKVHKDTEMLTDVCSVKDRLLECLDTYVEKDPFWHAVGRFQYQQILLSYENFTEDSAAYEQGRLLKAYQASVKDIDDQVGLIWDQLVTSGAIANTVVVIFSDHGEELLEHGRLGHSNFYEHTAKIPLLIYSPKNLSKLDIARPVSLVDLMPITMDLLKLPTPKQAQGRSLSQKSQGIVYGNTLKSEYLIMGPWKYLSDAFGHEALYHLGLDSNETTNLLEYKNRWAEGAYNKILEEKDRIQINYILSE